MDDFKSVLDDLDGLDLFTGVSSVEHQTIDETFNDGAFSFFEFLLLPSSGGMGDHDLGLFLSDGDVVSEANITNLRLLILTVYGNLLRQWSNPIFQKVLRCFPF